jgi:endonuclease YncB( thermonuclease family)
MPFFVIRGTFHLVGKDRKGNPRGYEPDGDSIRFKPADPKLLDRLIVVRAPAQLDSSGTINLRFEGIDALELHYTPQVKGGRESHQPRPLADQARDFLTGLLGLNPVPYEADGIRVKPPVQRDATPGYILSRTLETNGRPVSFAFIGDPPAPDGASVRLTTGWLRRSLNHKLLAKGQVYPLFYDGLFVDLRNALASATLQARMAGLGLWPQDRSQRGLRVTAQADLESRGVIFPKLFRRLTEYLVEHKSGAAGFDEWLAEKNEAIFDLRRLNFTHFDNAVTVTGDRVRMTRLPEELVFISAR